ncbi:MAG TPA: two-component sensor histidine kinase [Treponema sp.]|nr:two-component sensor histidine kinase [Treponema sp.]
MQNFSNRVYEKLSKLSKNQIEQLFSELHTENSVLRSIFQSLSTGLVTVDKNCHILEINKAAERLLSINNYSKDDEDLTLPDYIEDDEILQFFKDCFDKNKTNVSDEFTIKTSGGSVRFIEIFVSSLVQESSITGSIILIDDVTEKRNQEILLHRMEAMAGLTNIAASVAHEIKNPLGAISIHIQLLQKAIRKKREGDGMLPDKKFTENYLDVVNQEIDRLNKIVVDFLMAVRPVSAQLELVNPNKILTDFVAFITPEFTEKHVKVESEFCPNCPKLLLDEKLFREVIVNLAQNALYAITERFDAFNKSKTLGQVAGGRLGISSLIKDDKFILTFTDNGTGMSEETLSRVFEPYYTTKANGTGLGLAMCYKIIKEFRGDISVTSTVGQGSEFTITLPVPQTTQKLLTHNSSGGMIKITSL